MNYIVLHSISHVFFVAPRIMGHQVPLSSTISQSFFRLIPFSGKTNHLILRHPFLLLPSIFPSIRVFPSESALCIRQPKYWSFNCSISPSNEYSCLISFRIDWFDLLAVQGILRVFSSTIVKKLLFFSAQSSS